MGISHIDRSEKLADLLKNVCSDGSHYQELCALVIYNVGGFNPAELDKVIFQIFLMHHWITSNKKLSANKMYHPKEHEYRSFLDTFSHLLKNYYYEYKKITGQRPPENKYLPVRFQQIFNSSSYEKSSENS